MPITLDNTSITGLGVGGLPAGSVNATTLANNAVTRAKIGYAGAVLQVLQTVKTNKSTTTSFTPVDVPGLSVTITPTNASSKILIFTTINYSGGTNMYGAFNVMRGGSNVVVGTYATGNQIAATIGGGVVSAASGDYKNNTAANTYLDSPNTTGATTYKVQFRTTWQGTTITINAPFQIQDLSYIINGTSSITLMEIAG